MDTNAQTTKSISLEKYGIVNVSEIRYNPSYDYLYNEELNPVLEGFERGQLSELGAVNVKKTLLKPKIAVPVTRRKPPSQRLASLNPEKPETKKLIWGFP